QTAGSALDQVTANLQAIRDLAVQSANGTYTASDRSSIDQEVQQRLAEITRIANQTTFNGSKVLDGSLGTKSFQVGADVGQTISVSLGTSVKASAMGQIAQVETGNLSGAFVDASGNAQTMDLSKISSPAPTARQLRFPARPAACRTWPTRSMPQASPASVRRSTATAASACSPTAASRWPTAARPQAVR